MIMGSDVMVTVACQLPGLGSLGQMVGGGSGELGSTAVVTAGLVFVMSSACGAGGLLVLEKTEFLSAGSQASA